MGKEKEIKDFDETDKKILEILTQDARMQWQDIGERVHLTGQGVKNRVNKLEKAGILKNYTINVDYKKIGYEMTAFVSVFMKTVNHGEFSQFVKNNPLIIEAHKTGGEACYMMKVCVSSSEELTLLMDEVLRYGNYKVGLSLQQVK